MLPTQEHRLGLDPDSRDEVNGVDACRVFLWAAWEAGIRWTWEAEQILGRADVDWHHLAKYLAGCGLARPLLKSLKDPNLTRWAPQFFVERLKTTAVEDGVKELIQREAIRQITLVLHEMSAQGVLLKGAALLALAAGGNDASSRRATWDIDLYVDPPLAQMVHRRLLEIGFSGSVDVPRSAPHHLAPILFKGIPVEIHTRILPSFWGLPEKEMLAHRRPLPEMEPLCTLDPAGFMLHAGTHASTHLFAQGLKTAWDLLWIRTRFPAIDWDWLARWVEASWMPRGFWVPVCVLCQALHIPVPGEFLGRAPVDTRQRTVETIARHRLFHALEGPYALNPFSKNGMFLLLHDSWISRVRYLAALLGKDAAEARRSARRHISSQALGQIPHQLRQAWFHWQQYRRAHARALAAPEA